MLFYLCNIIHAFRFSNKNHPTAVENDGNGPPQKRYRGATDLKSNKSCCRAWLATFCNEKHGTRFICCLPGI